MDDLIFEYSLISVPSDVLERLNSRLSERADYMVQAGRNRPGALEVYSWLISFGPFIDELDPNGEESSTSLKGEWYAATFVPNYEKNSYLGQDQLHLIIAKAAGVLNGIKNGSVRIVSGRKQLRSSGQYILHKRDLPLQPNLVFVLMPFTEKWSDYIWNKQIKPIVESVSEYPLVCKRADDLYGHDIMQDIYESILSARIIVADITNRNANVFYELGIAHTLGKEVLLLSQGTDHIPFDLNRFRHIIYSNDGPGYENLSTQLPATTASAF